MKRFIFMLIIISTVYSSFLFSQEDKNVVFRVSPLAFGVESRIKGNFSIYNNIGLAISFVYKDRVVKSEIPLFIQVNPRLYYNIQKRRSQGKRVDKFSGNYVAILFTQVLASWGSDDDKLRASIAPVWGLQRNIGKYGYFNLCFGLGVNFMEDKTRLGIQALFGLGFAF